MFNFIDYNAKKNQIENLMHQPMVPTSNPIIQPQTNRGFQQNAGFQGQEQSNTNPFFIQVNLHTSFTKWLTVLCRVKGLLSLPSIHLYELEIHVWEHQHHPENSKFCCKKFFYSHCTEHALSN